MTPDPRALIVLLMSASEAQAELLAPGQSRRDLPFEVVDQRPMLAARIAGTSGRMMFDTGTPEVVFLNREALALPEGKVVGKGFAASGQPIEVHLHDAPPVEIAGQAVVTGPVVASGNFGFVESAYGADYLGFIGMPAVGGGAFVLDYGRNLLTVLATDADGTLREPPPAAADVMAHLTFSLIDGEQPTTGAFIGTLPVVLDFDTGDQGTLFLRTETQTRLLADGNLVATGTGAVLTGVTFGGTTFSDLAVRLVEAGGPEDKRPWPGSDGLRLGADFLSGHPSLWNMPAGTITLLRPGSPFLSPR
jgi:hypothetical protein